jgi:DNA replication protein DnaC
MSRRRRLPRKHLAADRSTSARRSERNAPCEQGKKPFGRWGEVFGDDTVAVMTDRIAYHAGVIALKGDSYRLRNRNLGRAPNPTDD